MTMEELAAALQLDGRTQDFMMRTGWEAAEACFDLRMPLLQDDFLLEQCRKIGYREDFGAGLLKAARRARELPALANCVHYLHFYYYVRRFGGVSYAVSLPDMTPVDGAETHGFLMIAIALGAIPLVEKSYAALGLPPEYACDTVRWIAGAIDEYRAGHDGRFGLTATKPHWIRHYIEGELFRIGRLEYMVQPPLNYLPAVYRRKADGRVIALCRDGWRLRRDGLLLWEDEAPETAFRVARLIDNEDAITGVPIDPTGVAEVERSVTLELHEYEPLWTPWSLVPGIHIPGGGGMTPEACCDSLRRAVEFFRRHFGREVAGFSCSSWIFNPDFERELPQSNLADFMRQVYLFPFASVGVEGLAFVFGHQEADWSGYPADNSLRRAFHRIRESGRRLKAGGMFIEANGLASYGSEYYRHAGRYTL